MKTVVLAPGSSELPAGWSEAQFRDALQHAADRWSYPNVQCAVKVVVTDAQPEWRATQDGLNVVAVRGRTWCHNERCGGTSTYPLRATAMTTTFPEDGHGNSVGEGDVELNGVAFRFTDPAHPAAMGVAPPWSVPIEPVLVHEIGHVLGLRDVCGGERRHSGQPVTDACSEADQDRVMFAANRRGTPTTADIDELCSIYPPESVTATASTSFAGASFFSLLAALVILVIRGRARLRGHALRTARSSVTRPVTARSE